MPVLTDLFFMWYSMLSQYKFETNALQTFTYFKVMVA